MTIGLCERERERERVRDLFMYSQKKLLALVVVDSRMTENYTRYYIMEITLPNERSHGY